jgi:hypothetical protein
MSRTWVTCREDIGVRVRENEAGEVAIHYRGQGFGFRELKASTALSEGRGAAPPPRPHPRSYVAACQRGSVILRRQGYGNIRTPSFSPAW